LSGSRLVIVSSILGHREYKSRAISSDSKKQGRLSLAMQICDADLQLYLYVRVADPNSHGEVGTGII
jgi:hypothetical protein